MIIMDYKRLEAFCKVYEQRSFSKAGEELFLAQPTISAHVSALERSLGVRLFDRLGRNILPTQAGETLYVYARNAFAQLETAQAEIQMLQDKVTGALIVGGSTIPAHYLLPQRLSSYKKLHPDVDLELVVSDTHSIVEKVIAGDVHVGVVGALEENADLEYSPILQDDMIVIAGKEHAGQLPETIDAKALRVASWVMREAGSGSRRAFENGLNGMSLSLRELNVALTVESTQAVLQCVRANLGLSFTSRLAAQDAIDSGELVEIVVPELYMPRSFYCVFLKRRTLFPAVSYFISHLKKMKDE